MGEEGLSGTSCRLAGRDSTLLVDIMPKKCDTSSERKIAKSIRLTKQDKKSYTVENEHKCCSWRFSSKGLGVDNGKRRTETANGEKVEKGENEGVV